MNTAVASEHARPVRDVSIADFAGAISPHIFSTRVVVAAQLTGAPTVYPIHGDDTN